MTHLARSSVPVVVDLFAGAGLFSRAFRDLGFRVDRAIELDPVAAETYALNNGRHVEVADVRKRDTSACDILIAGPPCQGFSTLGSRNPSDPRNLLSLEVVRWARATRPLIVVVENVAAFLKAPVWALLKNELESIGYEVSAGIYDAVDFGVAQRRARSFTFASRVGLPQLNPDKRATGPVSVKEAWEGLPPTPNGRNQHYAPEPTPLARSRMRVIPTGGDKRDLMRHAPQLCPPSWWKTRNEVTDIWGRMLWEEPANTLRTGLLDPTKGRYIHPEQDRVISLREAARLHSIDDTWVFHGSPSRIARQIGNSVPPLLGRAIAGAIAKAMRA
jgi:DNA (cytosine-5)-methyltransferase 1